MMNKRKQSGFTIAELLISNTLSLSIISTVLLGYLATYTGTMVWPEYFGPLS
jgi:Tfp pilus assembly protein PilW